MTVARIAARPVPSLWRRRPSLVLAALSGGLAASVLASLCIGATGTPLARVLAVLGQSWNAPGGDGLVVLQVRLPRVILGALVGAALAASGALMQGLFRNPLADPGLVGVSAGAALAAAATIMLGDNLLSSSTGALPFAALPVGAFLGGLLTTLGLYLVATRGGRTSVATMLLAGVAFGALAGAGMGLFAYLSNDRQLRDLSFWSLGSLSGATWTKAKTVAPLILPMLLATPFLARALNALALGEAEAFHLGIPVQRMKAAAIFLVAVAVGASVACAGIIGFVGIVVPHVLRLIAGPDHRLLLPASALLGATLLISADSIARVIVAPAELPIGILTAAIGAPFFLWLLLRHQGGALQ
ncbi:FecCD family ABC transporter permease [Microvirga antarctica]|uniref:FecCD family ABC transporter permease n=1 Tax=Microvirga antarctica TaxID=2819233 RepID=UPI001B315FCC|nr:iron ABC transporter permease [Microvirga antarctica]